MIKNETVPGAHWLKTLDCLLRRVAIDQNQKGGEEEDGVRSQGAVTLGVIHARPTLQARVREFRAHIPTKLRDRREVHGPVILAE